MRISERRFGAWERDQPPPSDIASHEVKCPRCGLQGSLQWVLSCYCTGTLPNHLGNPLVDARTGHLLRIRADDDHVVGSYDHTADQCGHYWCPDLILEDALTGAVLATGLLAFDS